MRFIIEGFTAAAEYMKVSESSFKALVKTGDVKPTSSLDEVPRFYIDELDVMAARMVAYESLARLRKALATREELRALDLIIKEGL